MKKCIIWLRKDLRLNDHAGFAKAITNGYEIKNQLNELGGDLYIHRPREGQSVADCLKDLIKGYAAEVIYWGRRYEPEIVERDTALKEQLISGGLEVCSFKTHVLFEPHTVKNKAGKHFKVFTPFWKKCLTLKVDHLTEISQKQRKAVNWYIANEGGCIDDLNLLPVIAWDTGFYECWKPQRAEGLKRLADMVSSKYKSYNDSEVYHAFTNSYNDVAEKGYLRQLFWREFSYHLMFNEPHTPNKALRPEYEQFPWEKNETFLDAWKKGQTGFPIVDAGMRQLWQTGWMHNRVRMIVGSLLVKHMLQDWREGASWFWDTLVDADLANNTMGWQWIGGCGADASPYFRIFNPIT